MLTVRVKKGQKVRLLKDEKILATIHSTSDTKLKISAPANVEIKYNE